MGCEKCGRQWYLEYTECGWHVSSVPFFGARYYDRWEFFPTRPEAIAWLYGHEVN